MCLQMMVTISEHPTFTCPICRLISLFPRVFGLHMFSTGGYPRGYAAGFCCIIGSRLFSNSHPSLLSLLIAVRSSNHTGGGTLSLPYRGEFVAVAWWHAYDLLLSLDIRDTPLPSPSTVSRLGA